MSEAFKKELKALQYVMDNMRPTSVTKGKDGKWYITITCPKALNKPTLLFKELPGAELVE